MTRSELASAAATPTVPVSTPAVTASRLITTAVAATGASRDSDILNIGWPLRSGSSTNRWDSMAMTRVSDTRMASTAQNCQFTGTFENHGSSRMVDARCSRVGVSHRYRGQW